MDIFGLKVIVVHIVFSTHRNKNTRKFATEAQKKSGNKKKKRGNVIEMFIYPQHSFLLCNSAAYYSYQKQKISS